MTLNKDEIICFLSNNREQTLMVPSPVLMVHRQDLWAREQRIPLVEVFTLLEDPSALIPTKLQFIT